jgi:hypothetical protein
MEEPAKTYPTDEPEAEAFNLREKFRRKIPDGAKGQDVAGERAKEGPPCKWHSLACRSSLT